MDHLNPSNNQPIGQAPHSHPWPDNVSLNTPAFQSGANAEPLVRGDFSPPGKFATRFEWAELRQKLAASIGLDSCRVRALHKGEQDGLSLAIIAEESLRMGGIPRLWGGQSYNSHFALVSFPDLAPEQAREIFSWDAKGGSSTSKAAIANGANKVAYILNEPGHQDEIAIISYDRDSKTTVKIDRVNLAQMGLWDTTITNLVTIALSPDGKFLWVQNSNNNVACIRLSEMAPEAAKFRGDINPADFSANGKVLSHIVGPEEKIRFSRDGSVVQIVDRVSYYPRLEFQIEYTSDGVGLRQTAPRLPQYD